MTHSTESLLVLGPRATGKTSFILSHLAGKPEVVHIDLLSTEQYRRYLVEPEQLFREVTAQLKHHAKLIVFIDEVQRIPDLLNEVHRCLNHFEAKVQFVLSGSSARKLKHSGANLLAGRALKLGFHPLSLDEVSFNDHLDQILCWGLLPKAFSLALQCQTTSQPDPTLVRYLKTYAGIYLEEEINRETEIKKLDSFARLLEYAAIHNGEPINQRRAATAAGLHSETSKEYFQILVDTLIAWEVPTWSYSIRERLQQASKFYLFDTGVINALCDDLSTGLKPGTYRYGRLFENLCVTEILKQIDLKQSSLKAFHYRDQRGQEIDLILQKRADTNPIALEIKSAETPDPTEIKTLTRFKDRYPKSRCLVLCRTPRAYDVGGIEILPFVDGIRSLF